VKDARKSAGYALVLIAILYTTAPAIAVFKTNLIETVNGKDYSSMPAWFTKWETTGLLTFEDGDGKIQYTTTTQGRSIFSPRGQRKQRQRIDH
jgi:cation/acetate symporter